MYKKTPRLTLQMRGWHSEANSRLTRQSCKSGNFRSSALTKPTMASSRFRERVLSGQDSLDASVSSVMPILWLRGDRISFSVQANSIRAPGPGST